MVIAPVVAKWTTPEPKHVKQNTSAQSCLAAVLCYGQEERQVPTAKKATAQFQSRCSVCILSAFGRFLHTTILSTELYNLHISQEHFPSEDS